MGVYIGENNIPPNVDATKFVGWMSTMALLGFASSCAAGLYFDLKKGVKEKQMSYNSLQEGIAGGICVMIPAPMVAGAALALGTFLAYTGDMIVHMFAH